MRAIFTGLLLAGSMFTANAHENQCEVDIELGIIVNPTQIRLLEKDRTVVQINNDEQLIINGDVIELDDDASRLLAEYSMGIREGVPEVVQLALDGVELGLTAAVEVMDGLDLSGDSRQTFEDAIVEIKEGLSKHFSRKDDTYYLAAQNIEDIEDVLSEEMERELENAISSSVGSLLIAFGGALQAEDGSFEEKMEAFGQRMERMGERIELEVQDRADELALRAEAFCVDLREMDDIETQLHELVPELEDYELIILKN